MRKGRRNRRLIAPCLPPVHTNSHAIQPGVVQASQTQTRASAPRQTKSESTWMCPLPGHTYNQSTLDSEAERFLPLSLLPRPTMRLLRPASPRRAPSAGSRVSALRSAWACVKPILRRFCAVSAFGKRRPFAKKGSGRRLRTNGATNKWGVLCLNRRWSTPPS